MIQQTLANTFGQEQFSLPMANEAVLESNPDIKIPSIRARIYEGINDGYFERISRGVYRCTQEGVTLLCVLGNGRDLSRVKESSVDAIITDHPYSLDKKSLKGGNRNFADYEGFWYEAEDFIQKARVLKEGGFLVEFLPEESSTNYEYLYSIKQMAKAAGFEYYSKVPWRKGDFVANTGRKSKGTEDIMFFSKGKARCLRPDVKKDKADPSGKHFMSGTTAMLPVEFNVSPPSKKGRVHQAEKPVELLKQIIEMVTLPGEKIVDQFAGSGNLGIAAVKTNRKALLFEKDEETFNKMLDNIEQKIS